MHSSARIRVTVYSREGAHSEIREFNTADPQCADQYGSTVQEITRMVAADYCDSGSVYGENLDDPSDTYTVTRT